jgi:hypothetical protein
MIRARCISFTPKEWPGRVAPRVQCNWTRVQVFVRSRAPADATAQTLRAEECANTDRPLHTSVPKLFAHHRQGIYISRCFDERSADARLSWNVETPTYINALMMVSEAPSAAADGAQHSPPDTPPVVTGGLGRIRVKISIFLPITAIKFIFCGLVLLAPASPLE